MKVSPCCSWGYILVGLAKLPQQNGNSFWQGQYTILWFSVNLLHKSHFMKVATCILFFLLHGPGIAICERFKAPIGHSEKHCDPPLAFERYLDADLISVVEIGISKESLARFPSTTTFIYIQDLLPFRVFFLICQISIEVNRKGRASKWLICHESKVCLEQNDLTLEVILFV